MAIQGYEDLVVRFAAVFEYARSPDRGQSRIDILECWSSSIPGYLNLIRAEDHSRVDEDQFSENLSCVIPLSTC